VSHPAAPEDICPGRQHKVTAGDLELGSPVELVLLSVKDRAARCQVLGTARAITLRATRLWDVVPGEIIVVTPRKQWNYAGHLYLSGDVESARRGTGVGRVITGGHCSVNHRR